MWLPVFDLRHGYLLVERPWRRYRGVSRDPWDAVITAYYCNALEPSMRKRVDDMIQKSDANPYYPKFCADKVELASLLEFTLGMAKEVEVLGFHSSLLQTRGSPTSEEGSARFLGVDVVPCGAISLLSLLEQGGS